MNGKSCLSGQKLCPGAETADRRYGSGVRKNGVNVSSYYKWQRKVYALAQAQQEVQFADVTPVESAPCGNVAVTVRISGAEADIHSGADAATVETVLRFLKSC